jgi:hypothetical protein
MDLYPEIAVALGEIKEGFLSRTIGDSCGGVTGACPPSWLSDGDMASRLREHGVNSRVIRRG